MRKSFRYRLVGNNETLGKAERWLGLCRSLYNAGLEQRADAYRRSRTRISKYDQINEIPELKADFPEYGEVGSQVLQDVLERLDRAYAGFFRRIRNGEKAGYPRFRGRHRYDSFTLKQTGWKLDSRYLAIRNIGRLKMRLSRPIEGDIKTITIRREPTGKWYACFSCDNVPERRLPESGKTIGLDVGIKSFLVDSDGNNVDNPKHLNKSLAYLRRCSRSLHRKKLHSQRRGKARIILAKAYEKVRNQRLDFLHKVANHYVRNYGALVFEDLAIRNMVRNHKLARSISDAGWGMFYGLCAYKAEEAGRRIVRISRFEPTSKRCSACGAINQDLTLSDRQWVCKSCGALHDRDYNAAKNICRVGQTLQEVTYGSSQSVS